MYIAEDYMSEVVKWGNVDYYEQYVRRIQLPFVAAPVSTVSAEQQRERRKEAARRLVELNARKREEKVCLSWLIYSLFFQFLFPLFIFHFMNFIHIL